MEIALISGKTLRLKSKNSTIIVDPSSSTPKTEADAVLLTEADDSGASKIEGARVVLKGSGEYEVGGVKISGFASGDKTVFVLDLDGISTVVGSSSALSQIASKLDEVPALVINADTFDPAIISTLSPSILAIYGENRVEALKSIGKEGATTSSKYSAKKDSLPTEMEVISLG